MKDAISKNTYILWMSQSWNANTDLHRIWWWWYASSAHLLRDKCSDRKHLYATQICIIMKVLYIAFTWRLRICASRRTFISTNICVRAAWTLYVDRSRMLIFIHPKGWAIFEMPLLIAVAYRSIYLVQSSQVCLCYVSAHPGALAKRIFFYKRSTRMRIV